MDVFQENYKIYYNLMCILGLSPYDHSTRASIKRIFIPTFMLACVINQVSSLRNIEPTLNDIIVLLSGTIPISMFCLRYISFLYTFPTVKYMLDNLQHDLSTLKDPLEVQMLLKDSILAKQVVAVYLALTSLGSILLFGILVAPMLMQSNAYLRCLRLLGYFYSERNLYSRVTSVHVFMTTIYGQLTFICTEGALTIISSYASGLLHIASYRIKNAVSETVSLGGTKPLNIRPAVDMHRQAIRQVTNYTNGVMMTTLLIVVLAIVSFGITAFRLLMGITVVKEIGNTLLGFQLVMAHLALIFGNNYSGQIVMDTSVNFIYETYDTLWYHLPPKMQKMMLFMMIKTQTQVEISFARLFILCFEGFSMMMSTSFSYFTLLCSVH